MNHYRYEIVRYANDPYDEYCVSFSTKVELRTFNVHKETPKGFWIGYGSVKSIHGFSKWVSKTSRKRYAYPTKELAINNLIKRTEMRIGILNAHITHCKVGLQMAKQLLPVSKK